MKNLLISALVLGLTLVTIGEATGGASQQPQAAKGTAQAQAQEGKAAMKKGPSDEEIVAAQKPFYPLHVCLVSGDPLVDGEIKDVVHDGRLVRLCCQMCKKALDTNAEALFAKLDAAAVLAQKPYYPITDCPISEEPLGSMGDPIELVHEGRLARLCCKGCVKSFQKTPARYFASIDQAMIADQKKDYTSNTCAVSGEPLGDDAYDYLYGYRLVRTCCKKCVKAIEANPNKYVAKNAVKRESK